MHKIQRRATGNTGRTKRKFNQNKNTTQYVSDTITRIQEKLEDTKGAIIIRISKKNRQQNGQRKRYKRTNYDLQNIHILLAKYRVTRTTLTTGGELRCSGRVGSSWSTSGPRRLNLVANPVIGR
jgi:hypothetical protein